LEKIALLQFWVWRWLARIANVLFVRWHFSLFANKIFIVYFFFFLHEAQRFEYGS